MDYHCLNMDDTPMIVMKLIYNLVGGLEHLDYFSIYWVFNNPKWRTHIFQRGWSHQPGISRSQKTCWFRQLKWCFSQQGLVVLKDMARWFDIRLSWWCPPGIFGWNIMKFYSNGQKLENISSNLQSETDIRNFESCTVPTILMCFLKMVILHRYVR